MSEVLVGLRQWRALIAMAMSAPKPLSDREIRAAVHAWSPEDWGRDVPDALRSLGLIGHACSPGDHALTLDCQMRLTPAGESARMDKRAHTLRRKQLKKYLPV